MNLTRTVLSLVALAPLALAAAEQGSYVWTGARGAIGRAPRIDVGITSYGKDGPSEERRIRPEAHVTALRAELAALRLSEAVDGPSSELEAARLELWIRACDAEPFAGQGELLVELALDRAESLAARGESEAALAATQELLVPARLVAQAGDLELREADAAWLERAAAWLADPSLFALRAKLAPRRSTQAASQDVDAVIEEHLRQGNVEAVLQFGLRAVPVAEALVRAEPEAYRAAASDDVLTVLFKLSEERGARLALELLANPGEVLPVRVLRAMRTAQVLENEGTWDFVRGPGDDDGMRSARLREPVWATVVETLCEQSVVAADACTEVGLLVSMDAVTPALSAFLERAIHGEDPVLAQRALVALAEASRRPTVRPLLERLLTSDIERVRVVAAEGLSEFEECPALWARVADPSVDVRAAIVRCLRPERREVLSIHGVRGFQLRSSNVLSLRGLDRGGMRALGALLEDQEPSIYLPALDILRDNQELPMSSETVRALTGHRDVRVRVLLPHVRVGTLPDPLVLETLAGDPEAAVIGSVDASLKGLSQVGPLPTADNPMRSGWRVLLQMSTPWEDTYLPALKRRLAHPTAQREPLRAVVHVAARTSQGADSLARLATERGDAALAAFLVECFSTQPTWSRGTTPWSLIDPGVARDLLALAWGTPPDPGWVEPVVKCMLDAPAAYRTAAAEWLANEGLPPTVRFLGARLSASIADDAWGTRLLAFVGGEDAGQRAALGELAKLYFAVGAEVQHADLAGRLIDDLSQRPGLPDDVTASLCRGLAGRATLNPAAAERVLTRWSSRGSSYRPVLYVALRSIQATEEDPNLSIFETALRSEDADTVTATLQAMARLGVRAHLPLLERALGGEFAPSANERKELQGEAAEALACYLDDEAAQILLRGVGMTTDAGVRDACFAALETIRRYQDERARWNSRADAGRARAEAIAELVGLIEAGDAAQKVEAVRALGTLEAFEELPRLVRLAGARDAALAKAAREALERIHAAGGKD